MRNVIMYAFRLTIGKMIEMSFLDNYKRVVIKIGSSTLTHKRTEEHTSELQSQHEIVCRLQHEK